MNTIKTVLEIKVRVKLLSIAKHLDMVGTKTERLECSKKLGIKDSNKAMAKLLKLYEKDFEILEIKKHYERI